MPFKIFEGGLQTPPSPQTPYIAYGKGQKLKIWILFLPWLKCIHSILKGIILTFKQKLDVINRPHCRVLSLKWLFLVKNGNFFTFSCCGVRKKSSNFPFNVFSVPFRLIGIHFDHCKNKIQIFNFCLFHRLYRGSEVTVGSEDPLQISFKGQICSRGVKWNTFWLWPIWN